MIQYPSATNTGGAVTTLGLKGCREGPWRESTLMELSLGQGLQLAMVTPCEQSLAKNPQVPSPPSLQPPLVLPKGHTKWKPEDESVYMG